MNAAGKHSQPYPWEQRKLGETFLFKKNNTFSRSELSFENGYVKNIHYGDILVKYNEYLNVHNNSNIPFVTQNIPSDFSSSYLQDGDIVMADTAEDETVGKSTEISSLSSNDRVLAGLHTIPLSPKQKFGSGFLGFYLNSNSYHDKLRPLMQGIKVTSISKKNLKNTILQFPKELEEQKRIGKLFIKLNRTITLHEEKHRQLERLKKALLQKMFADETGYPALRFKGFTAKWEQRKPKNYLRESRILGSTGVDAKKLTVKLWGKGVVEKKESISGSSNTRYYIRHAEQLMYGKLDFLHAAFGIVPKELDKYESTADSPAFDIIDGNPKFLLESFLRKEFYLRNGQRANGSRKAKRIHEKDFLEMPILVPYKSEQTKIGNLINSLDKTITLHDKKIQYLKQLKRGLLQKMFV